MDWQGLNTVLFYIPRGISFLGTLIILVGVLSALGQYLVYFFSRDYSDSGKKINSIRLNLGRTLILGLEFIVAADLIRTTTTPDYYAVGILAIIVLIRVVLSFSLNREIQALSHEK